MTHIRQWQLWTLPRPLQAVLVGLAVAASAVLLLVGSMSPRSSWLQWVLFLLLCAAGLLFDSVARRGGRVSDEAGGPVISSYTVWVFLGVAACSLPQAVLLAGLLCLSDDLRVRLRDGAPVALHRVVFNAALAVLATALSAWVYAAASAAFPASGGPGRLLLAGVLAFATLQAVTQSVVATVFMLAEGRPYHYPTSVALHMSYQEVGLASLGLLLGFAWLSHPLLALAGLPTVTLLQQALLHDHLRNAADRDRKTGVLTSARWQRLAQQRLTGATRRNEELGVLLVDLDHFKAVNDTYGHLAGDEVLVAVANALHALVRKEDQVGRFGGEEFVVLLPRATPTTVADVAERIRAGIASLEVPIAGRMQPLTVTTSVGSAAYPRDAADLDELLGAADRALYAAKAAGRNAVRAAGQPVVPTAAASRLDEGSVGDRGAGDELVGDGVPAMRCPR